jgi:putative ABC transport system ATP-binding protein
VEVDSLDEVGVKKVQRDPLVKLEGISKRYERGSVSFVALDGVSLQIGRGEYVTMTGPSGSGKSTLMNLIGCLDVPSSGRLTDGQDVACLDERALAKIRNEIIGFVLQQFNLLTPLIAPKNVQLPLIYACVPLDEKMERSVALLERVGLGDHLEHKPMEMPGGQQQRVAIARALASNPPLILADEPTGNLDSKSAVEVLSLFEELHGSGRTIVVITHDNEVAARAERVIKIRDGKVVS